MEDRINNYMFNTIESTINFDDLFEYSSVIISLFVSVIAIAITVYTVRKQNRTSVFEKRLEVFRLVTFIAKYSNYINDEYYSTTIFSKTSCFEDLMENNIHLYGIWVNQRLIYSDACSDHTRNNLVSRAMTGQMDHELKAIMSAYLSQDLYVLQQGIFVFNGRIADTIHKTLQTYQAFIENLMSIPNGNGSHSVENIKVYYNDFVSVGLKWDDGSKMKKQMNKDMQIL